MKISVAGAISLLLLSLVYVQPVALRRLVMSRRAWIVDSVTKAGKQQLLHSFLYPHAAQFGKTWVGGEDGQVFCGLVNEKAANGTYSGFRNFAVMGVFISYPEGDTRSAESWRSKPPNLLENDVMTFGDLSWSEVERRIGVACSTPFPS